MMAPVATPATPAMRQDVTPSKKRLRAAWESSGGAEESPARVFVSTGALRLQSVATRFVTVQKCREQGK
jgi:hypothetical protein